MKTIAAKISLTKEQCVSYNYIYFFNELAVMYHMYFQPHLPKMSTMQCHKIRREGMWGMDPPPTFLQDQFSKTDKKLGEGVIS
jgi:hypothetical protein